MQERKLNPISVVLLLAAAWLLFFSDGASPFVEPPPFKADKLCVLVIEETDERGTYTAGQQDAMLGRDGPLSIRGYVASKGGEYILWDKDQQHTAEHLAWVGDALKKRGDKLPWIVAATPSTGFAKELPKTAEEAVADLKKIGGQ